LADSRRTLLSSPSLEVRDRDFIGTKIPEKYLGFASCELAKAFKKLDGLIEQKIAEEAADSTPPPFDLAKFDAANGPSDLAEAAE
jgi:hypothetical protein